MNKKGAKKPQNDFDSDHEQNSGEDEDEKKEEKAQKFENQPFDEAVELSDQGSEIESNEDQGTPQKEEPLTKQNKPKSLKKQDSNENSEEKGAEQVNVPGSYNPADYESLSVNSEIKELFKYISRYQPQHIDLETKLKAFIPDFIPAVGEVDAFLKMPRPDNVNETLGLNVVDEPALNQSKRAKIDLIMNEFMKKKEARQKPHNPFNRKR